MRTERAARIAARVDQGDHSDLPAAVKLAGARLWNFAGFLSADWRTTDWGTGERIDASAYIANSLTRRRRLNASRRSRAGGSGDGRPGT